MLDIAFREDESRIRAGNAAENMNALPFVPTCYFPFLFQLHGTVFLFCPFCDVCGFLCRQTRIKKQMDVKAFLWNGQAMYSPPIKAEGFFVSKWRSRDIAFYKTVPPFQRDHIIQPAFPKQAEIIIARKSLIPL